MKNGFSIATLAVFLLSGCVSDRPQAAKNAYESDYERFFQNVIVKEKTPHYVTYEYKDVRIDEIAFLASRYCQEQGGKEHKKTDLSAVVKLRSQEGVLV